MTTDAVKLPNLKAKIPVVHKLAYELRYHHGHTYLDRCGRILSLVERDHPQWVVDGGASAKGAALTNLELGSQFRFSSNSLVQTWEQAQEDDELSADDLNEFAAQADLLTSLVVAELGIKLEYLARIGFRIWYVFAADSREEAEGWLQSLGCWTVPDKLGTAFDGKIESTSAAIVLRCQDRCYRLNFSAGERQSQFDTGPNILGFRGRSLPKGQRQKLSEIQKRDVRERSRKRFRQTSSHVALIDVDAYQEDPQILEVPHFLKSTWEEGYKHLRQAIG